MNVYDFTGLQTIENKLELVSMYFVRQHKQITNKV
jgi:hypothetical protein